MILEKAQWIDRSLQIEGHRPSCVTPGGSQWILDGEKRGVSLPRPMKREFSHSAIHGGVQWTGTTDGIELLRFLWFWDVLFVYQLNFFRVTLHNGVSFTKKKKKRSNMRGKTILSRLNAQLARENKRIHAAAAEELVPNNFNSNDPWIAVCSAENTHKSRHFQS